MMQSGTRLAPPDYGSLHLRRSAAEQPTLHADDRERLEYLLARMLEASGSIGSSGDQARDRLALVIRRLAERGDDWALRVQRYWAQ